MARGALAVGIVYETFDTYARRTCEPEDAQVVETWAGDIWKEPNPR